MGRQNKDQEAVGSSILLLQQRFEQLERLKKMREERQLRRTLAQSRDVGRRMSGFASSEAAFHQDRLALGLNSNANHVSVACSRAIEHQHEFPSDDIVDTSLRL